MCGVVAVSVISRDSPEGHWRRTSCPRSSFP
jgi:hypothetical protein